ncbi:MAG: hypothetical protein IKD01_02525, partial [Oscillospiraceae bacterium]|nr:hypothetical protein [Oscillospiraceae bacterium]
MQRDLSFPAPRTSAAQLLPRTFGIFPSSLHTPLPLVSACPSMQIRKKFCNKVRNPNMAEKMNSMPAADKKRAIETAMQQIEK